MLTDVLDRVRRRLEKEVRQAQRFFYIRPFRNSAGLIYALQVEMPGIVGNGNRTRMTYWLWVTLDDYPISCPRAWIQEPPESQIRHVNIFRPRAPLNLPEVCPSAELKYQKDWAQGRIPIDERNILGFLRQVFYVLNNENFSSKARL